MISAKIFRSTSTEVFFNQAVEFELFENVKENEYILYVWSNDGAVVIGRNQDVMGEVNLALLENDGKTLARRLSGGGAVYHDKGNVNFTFIARSKVWSLERNRKVVLSALESLGLNPKLTGRNDVEIDSFKVSGNAYYKRDGIQLHHGTMLISSKVDEISKYLTPPTEKFVGKAVKSVSSRVKSLASFDPTITAESFVSKLVIEFQREFGKAEAEVIPIPCEDKICFFTDKEWRYGWSKSFVHQVTVFFNGERAHVKFNLENNLISDCHVSSDSMDENISNKISKEILGKNISTDSGAILDQIKGEVYGI